MQHCTLDLGSYIKDLSVVHNDMSSIVILDNSPGAYRSHPGTCESITDNNRNLLLRVTGCLRVSRISTNTFWHFEIMTTFNNYFLKQSTDWLRLLVLTEFLLDSDPENSLAFFDV